MNAVKNIINKELTRVFKDKKMVFSLFIMPGLVILIMYSLMGKMANNMESDIKEHVPTVYLQNAPQDFKSVITKSGFKADIKELNSTDNTDSIKKKIKNGDVELLVVFDKDFANTIQAYKNAGDAIPEVKTFYNSSEDYSNTARSNFVSTVLNSYQQTMLKQRIGNMEQLQVFYIDKDPKASDIVDQKKAGSKMISMLLPLLINIMLFSGALGLGVDAITGEKERGTLASMLISPIKRSQIVFGKLVSLGILSTISAVVYAVFTIIGIRQLAGGFSDSGQGSASSLGSISLTPIEILQFFIMLIIVVYLYVSLIAIVAVYARTSKEASTYAMPLMILVMLGSVMTMFSENSKKGLELFAIPIYNTAVSMQNVFTGELTMAQFGLTVGTTAILAALITMLITKAFNSEKVMFNA